MMHCEATYPGLVKWTVRAFEQLGWMVLAYKEGYGYKVTAYKKSLDHLVKCIEERHSIMQDADKRKDLEILLQKANVLRAHVKAIFKKA